MARYVTKPPSHTFTPFQLDYLPEVSVIRVVSVPMSPVAFLLTDATVLECPMLDDRRAMPHPPGSPCFCV